MAGVISVIAVLSRVGVNILGTGICVGAGFGGHVVPIGTYILGNGVRGGAGGCEAKEAVFGGVIVNERRRGEKEVQRKSTHDNFIRRL
jgi:hypothetical protein